MRWVVFLVCFLRFGRDFSNLVNYFIDKFREDSELFEVIYEVGGWVKL